MYGRVDVYLVVAVDSQYVLHNVGRACHVHSVCRNLKCQAFLVLVLYFHFKTFEYSLDVVLVDVLSYEFVDVVEFEVYNGWLYRSRVFVYDVASDFTAGNFLYGQCGELQHEYCVIWVASSFVSE